MKNKFYHYTSIILVLIFGLANLSCRFLANVPQKPAETIPVSTQAVATLEAKVKALMEQATQGQTVELSITEAEITSLLASQLGEQSEVIIENPQVYLREGEIQLTGSFQSGKLQVPIVAVFEPRAESTGQVSMKINAVSLGPFSAPDSLVKTIQNQADQFMTGFISTGGESVFIESIAISEGVMTLRGYRR